jgi:proline iminopeptidase
MANVPRSVTLALMLAAAAAATPSQAQSGLAVQEGRVVADDGVSLRYRMIGEGGEAVIVANTAAWLEEEFAVLAHDRTVIFFDARNRGGSDRVTDPQRIGMDREVRDIDEVRRHLGFDRVALIGWSYVGALVTLYARDYPDRVSRLVLIGALPPQTGTMAYGRGRGAGPDTAGVARIAALRAGEVDRSDPTGFCREHVRAVDLPPRMGSYRAIGRYRSDPCRFENEWPANLSAAVGAVIGQLGAWDWRPGLGDVRAPALVVHGTEDFVPIEGAVEWATALPDARIVRVAGAGHLPWLEAPEAVLGAIDTFLRGTWPTTAERVPDGRSAASEEVWASHDSFWQGLLSGDTLLLETLLADDWELAAGQGRRSKTEFLALFRDGQLRYDSISHSEVRVSRYGDAGVARGRALAWYTFGGQEGQERLQYLGVFGRVGQQWHMRAYQSAVAAVQPAPAGDQSDRDDVAAAVAGIYAAINSGSADHVIAYMAAGGYTEITASGRLASLDEAYIRRVLVPGFSADFRAVDLDIRVYTGVALVTGYRVGGILRPGAAPADARLGLSMLWVRDAAGTWRLTHVHLSPAPAG